MNMDGTVTKGLEFVKKFFPRAEITQPDDLTPSVEAALRTIGSLENPLPADIVQQFDLWGISIIHGKSIR